MKARWSIIPDIGDIDRCLSLAQEYDTAFEYNDFLVSFNVDILLFLNKLIL